MASSDAFTTPANTRGAPVVRDDRGSARRLRCQYHSWTYEIDRGSLISVPDERDFVDLDWHERCLPRAKCDTFGGFVFVNRDVDAIPLADWIGPMAEMLAPFRAEDLREVYRESRIVPCNWKVTAEAFLEVYHFRHIHSHDGVSVLDNRGAAMGLYPHGHSRMITPYSRQNLERSGLSSWDDWKPLNQHGMRTIDGVPGMVDCTSTAVSIFPNTIIPLGRIGFPINIFWPRRQRHHPPRLDLLRVAARGRRPVPRRAVDGVAGPPRRVQPDHGRRRDEHGPDAAVDGVSGAHRNPDQPTREPQNLAPPRGNRPDYRTRQHPPPN